MVPAIKTQQNTNQNQTTFRHFFAGPPWFGTFPHLNFYWKASLLYKECFCRDRSLLPNHTTDHPAPDDPDRDSNNVWTPDILPATLLPRHSGASHHSPHPFNTMEPEDVRYAASQHNKATEGIFWVQGLTFCLLMGTDGVFEEDFIHDWLFRSKPRPL